MMVSIGDEGLQNESSTIWNRTAMNLDGDQIRCRFESHSKSNNEFGFPLNEDFN